MSPALALGPLLSQARPPLHLELIRSGEAPRTHRPLDLEGLFVAHASYLSSLLFKLVGREGDVEDVVQDVFVLALSRLDSLKDPVAARAWLSQMAVRLALKKLKRRRFRRLLRLDDETTDDLTERVASSAAGPADVALLKAVFEALDGVAADDRVAWLLRVAEGRPLDEVATLCRCSLATAKRRIARVEQHLAEVFHE